MFHETSGLWRFGQHLPSQAEVDQDSESDHPTIQSLERDIDDCVISEDRLQELLMAAQARMNPLAPMLACAACGYRAMTPELTKFMCLPLDNPRFQHLKLNSEQLEQYENLGEYRLAASVTSLQLNSEAPSEHYYLHPELVTASASPEHPPQAVLCKKCMDALETRPGKEPKLPLFSIAAGIDFGRPERLPGLQPLSPAEWCLISPIRVYSHAIKLSAGTTSQPRTLSGHMVAFPHSGPEEAAAEARSNTHGTFPNVDDFSAFVQVLFIGTQQQWRGVSAGLLNGSVNCSAISIDFNNVIAWLRALQAINPLFQHIQIDNSDAMRERVQGLRQTAIDNAVVCDNERVVALNEQVTSDVAAVRTGDAGVTGSEPEVGPPSQNEDHGTEGTPQAGNRIPAEIPLSSSMYTSRNVSNVEDEAAAVMECIAHAVLPTERDDEGNAVPRPPIRIQRTSNTAVNEFLQNDLLFHGSFPNLFMFGKGILGHGPVSNSNMDHLLHQFTGAFT
eukprot:3940230-Rhodomonas_salina.1